MVGRRQAGELINSSRCPSLELTPRPSTTDREIYPGTARSSDTDDAMVARLVHGLQSHAPPAVSTFRGDREAKHRASGVRTKDLNQPSNEEVEVPGGTEKYQVDAAAPAPSHSGDWGISSIAQQANTGGCFRFVAESPSID